MIRGRERFSAGRVAGFSYPLDQMVIQGELLSRSDGNVVEGSRANQIQYYRLREVW